MSRIKCYIVIGAISRPGGTERAVTNLSVNLSKLGYDVQILSLCSRSFQNPYYSLPQSIKVNHMNLPQIPSNLVNKLWWYINMYRSLKTIIIPSSIIIGTGHNTNPIISLLKSNNRLVIGCEHIQKNVIPTTSKIVMRLTYPRLHALVLLSELAKKKYKLYNNHLEVIPNALPFTACQHSTHIHKRIIMVGRIDRNKAYDRAIPIFSFLQRKFPDWHIDIYGDGEEREKLEIMIRKRELVNVTIHEPVKDIDKKYKESDIMLMTSHSEAMPMVILEANSFGIPVIAYECEGTKELIKDKFTGMIIENDNEKKFCAVLESLITNIGTLIQYSSNAYNYVGNFSLENISKRWQEFFCTYLPKSK